MRLSLTFSFTKNLLLPLHYNEILQGLIYRLLDKAIAEKLHDEGFVLGKSPIASLVAIATAF